MENESYQRCAAVSLTVLVLSWHGHLIFSLLLYLKYWILLSLIAKSILPSTPALSFNVLLSKLTAVKQDCFRFYEEFSQATTPIQRAGLVVAGYIVGLLIGLMPGWMAGLLFGNAVALGWGKWWDIGRWVKTTMAGFM